MKIKTSLAIRRGTTLLPVYSPSNPLTV